MNLFLAEIISKGGALWESARLPEGSEAAAIFFLLLVCTGIALDFALVIYCLKRPSRSSDWVPALRKRAFSGRMVLVFFLIFLAFYMGVPEIYALLFDSVTIEPKTLLFQALVFHIPILAVLIGVLHFKKTSSRSSLGLTRGSTPRMLGLSVLLYLAAVPFILFYGWLYLILLNRLGYDFYRQEVMDVFFMPMSRWMRGAVFFVATVVAPVFEEVMFRGILFPWTVRRFGFWPGVSLVSLFFAGMHLHLPSFAPLLLLSAMLCVACARTRSLWVPVGMHACFNAVSIISLMLGG